MWVAGTLATNPVANDVLADTGALDAGEYYVQLFLSANIGLEVVFERRNAANDATVKSKVMPVTLSWTVVPPIIERIAQGERFRVKARADATGEVEASIVFHARPYPVASG